MKNTAVTFKNAKQKGEKLSMLTAYDYTTASLVDSAGINAILVGDSLGMVMLGYEDTLSVTMEDMIHHSKAVARGAKNTLVVTDMPFMSYQTSVYDAVINAGRLMKEGRAGAVKLEGGAEFAEHISAARPSAAGQQGLRVQCGRWLLPTPAWPQSRSAGQCGPEPPAHCGGTCRGRQWTAPPWAHPRACDSPPHGRPQRCGYRRDSHPAHSGHGSPLPPLPRCSSRSQSFPEWHQGSMATINT